MGSFIGIDRFEIIHMAHHRVLPHDAVGPEHVEVEVADVHRPALAVAVAGRLPHELGHHLPEVAALGDEVAVAAFLEGRIRWVDIAGVIASTMDGHDGAEADSLDAVLDGDAQARRYAENLLREAPTG